MNNYCDVWYSCDIYSIYYNEASGIFFFLYFEWFEDKFGESLGKFPLFVIYVKTYLLNATAG